jgi:phosphoenolpyruvate carboxylase
LEKQRRLALRKYKAALLELMELLTHSTKRVEVSEDLIRSIEKELFIVEEGKRWRINHEVYRSKLVIMLEKLNQVGKSIGGYQHAGELLEDLQLIQKSIQRHQPKGHQVKTLAKLIRQVELFGFHLVTLDIRNHSGEHESAISEIFGRINLVNDYGSLSEQQKLSLLQKVLQDPRPIVSIYEDYSPATQ